MPILTSNSWNSSFSDSSLTKASKASLVGAILSAQMSVMLSTTHLPVTITHRQLNTSRQHQLRLIAKDVIEKTVPTMDIDGFVQATCYGKINSDIMAAAKKVIKLRHVGLEKVKLIKTASAQTVLLEAKTKKPKAD